MEDGIVEESSIKKDEIQNNTGVVNNVEAITDVQQRLNTVSQENSDTMNATISKHTHKENKKSHQHSKVTDQRTIVKKKQPYTSQLLERLLSRSIQHERNLICQCIKYIVDNNFFE